MSFPIHGSLEAHVEGSILVIKATGPWNKESLDDSADQVKPLLESLYGKPWGVMATIYGEPIYVPEAADLLVDIVKEEKTLGRIASALIVKDSTEPMFARNHISDIYLRGGETFEIFDDETTAMAWLRAALAAASDPGI